MNKREYWIHALKLNLFTKRDWVLSAFAVTNVAKLKEGELPTQFPKYVGELAEINGDISFVTEGGSTETIEGAKIGQPLFNMQEVVELSSGDVVNLKSKVTTTYGKSLANAMVLGYSFGELIPYINEQWNMKAIESTIVDMVKSEIIKVPELKVFFKQIHFLSTFTQLCVPSATEKAMGTDPKIAIRKKELFKQYEGRLHDATVIAKIEDELIAMDKEWLKGDESLGFYIKPKYFNVARKHVHIMQGGSASFADESKIDLIPESLSEGYDLDSLPVMINTLRDGTFSRGAQTALGGEAVKTISRVFQNSNITQDDCKDSVGMPMVLTPINFKEYVGRYITGKSVPLTIEQLKGMVGKTINVRSPMACKSPNADFCKVCMGDEISENETALSMLAVQVGSAFLSLFLAAAHAKKLSTAKFDYKLSIT